MPETRDLDLRSLVAGATRVLLEAGIASPQHDARALAAAVLGRRRLDYLIGVELPPEFAASYAALIERRRLREPLQHLTGWAPFRHLELDVRPGVFVPRPETEVVAEPAIEAAAAVLAGGRQPLVVELCCGAGGLAISLASEVPGSRVLAMDASAEAVDLTRHNAALHGVAIEVCCADVRAADLWSCHEGAVDVVVSNPPYIPPDAEPLEPEVRDHDPDLALYGGGLDGLEVPRAVVHTAARLLRPGGTLTMEHAEVQDVAARELLQAAGFSQVRTIPDLTGRPRAVHGVWIGADRA